MPTSSYFVFYSEKKALLYLIIRSCIHATLSRSTLTALDIIVTRQILLCYSMYSLMKTNLNEFKISEYLTDNQFDIFFVNKKKIGLIKNECNDNIMMKFVGVTKCT